VSLASVLAVVGLVAVLALVVWLSRRIPQLWGPDPDEDDAS